MDLQTEDRVMEPSGHAGTVTEAQPNVVFVRRDADGEVRSHDIATVTKLATSDTVVRTRGGVVQPRAWTMGGGVD